MALNLVHRMVHSMAVSWGGLMVHLRALNSAHQMVTNLAHQMVTNLAHQMVH